MKIVNMDFTVGKKNKNKHNGTVKREPRRKKKKNTGSLFSQLNKKNTNNEAFELFFFF